MLDALLRRVEKSKITLMVRTDARDQELKRVREQNELKEFTEQLKRQQAESVRKAALERARQLQFFNPVLHAWLFHRVYSIVNTSFALWPVTIKIKGGHVRWLGRTFGREMGVHCLWKLLVRYTVPMLAQEGVGMSDLYCCLCGRGNYTLYASLTMIVSTELVSWFGGPPWWALDNALNHILGPATKQTSRGEARFYDVESYMESSTVRHMIKQNVWRSNRVPEALLAWHSDWMLPFRRSRSGTHYLPDEIVFKISAFLQPKFDENFDARAVLNVLCKKNYSVACFHAISHAASRQFTMKDS